MLSLRPDAHAVKVLIVEVGYSSELRYKEKLQAKMDQRKQLLQALNNAGYQCKILPVLLRITRGVCNSAQCCLTETGASHDRSTACKQLKDLKSRLEKLIPP